MLSLRFALLAQFPAFFLLSVLFLINYLIVRKRSAVKSVLWVLLFGVSLAVAILFCFLGIQADYWAISTMFKLSVWSWVGIVLVLIAVIVRFVFKLQKKHNARVIARELQKAEKSKNAAIAQAREEGRAEAMSGVVSGEPSPEASAEVTSETPASDFPDTSAPQL